MGDQDNLLTNLAAYIRGFSPAVRDIFERFRFAEQVDRLSKAGLLYQVTERFASRCIPTKSAITTWAWPSRS